MKKFLLKQIKQNSKKQRRWDTAHRLEHRRTKGKNRKRPGKEN